MKAVITAQFDTEIMEQLREQMEVVHTGWGVTGEALEENALVAELRDAEILVTEIEKCSTDVIESCPKLAFIGCCRNNPVNVDVKAATARGIPVVYGAGRNAQAVAEMALAMMIIAARQVGRALVDVRRMSWDFSCIVSYNEYKGYELAGKTAGIVGLGAIGRRVKRLCEAFDMQVIAHDPYLEESGNAPADVTFVGFHDLLKWADFVTLHVPDTPETASMIGAEELAMMKPTAYLVNTARGSHVDESALYSALKKRQITGAALDVFIKEPLPESHLFFELDNVVLLPHIGGATYDVITNQSRIMYEQIRNFLDGRPMDARYIKNPEVNRTRQ